MVAKVKERWSEVIDEARRARFSTLAALLMEAEGAIDGITPSGVQRVSVRFRHAILKEKWDKGEFSVRLKAVLEQMFDDRFWVVAELAESPKALGPRGMAVVPRREPSRKRQKASKEREGVVSRTSAEGAEMRLQAAWLSARMASEVVACLLGGASRADLQEAAELYEMSVQAEVLAFRIKVRGEQLAERIAAAQVERDERRAFSKEEKRLLYQLAAGLCERCGVRLGDDWHADHRYPYSKGGPTEISNGAALCATCNLIKGAKVLTGDEG